MLEYVLFNNELSLYIKAIIAFVLIFISFRIFINIVIKKYISSENILFEVIKSIKQPFYLFLSLYVSLMFLSIPSFPQKILDTVLFILIASQIISATQIIISFFALKTVDKNDHAKKYAINIVMKIVKYSLWVVAALFIMSNLNINITSFVAGLGVGGIAIAFALQNILSDLFSSFAIYFDKPFMVGDFIMFNNQKGTVKKIGIKTTRLKSIFGEEIVVSNKELTTAVIQNFKKMKERRVVFSFGVTYETSTKKIKRINEIIKEIFDKIEMTRLDRAHFKNFGDSSLGFEVSFYVKTPDYKEYMDIQQEINIKLMESFEKEKIGFAYPTQTIYTKNI
jgi:small-conductance mechanosensitive channel